MRVFFIIPFSFILLFSCHKGKNVDLIIHNARIQTMDDQNSIHQAMAIKDGKIVEVGPERQILNKYYAKKQIDAMGKDVLPGFTDAHGHLLSYIEQKLSADLVGAVSFDEVLVRLEKYQAKSKKKFIVGRGWDQSMWMSKELPDNTKLNQLFPNVPVCLYRIDGHAMLVNDALLKLAKIDLKTQINGGVILKNDGRITGILIDNAMNPIKALIPKFSKQSMIGALNEIQEELLQFGITGVHEAGIQFEDIQLFKDAINQNKLDINLYAMLVPSEKNFNFARKGIYEYKNLKIGSFKVIADGALGSRGARLKSEYHDHTGYFGIQTITNDSLSNIASFCLEQGYQLNIHAIGDATNKAILDLYAMVFEKNKDHRWRIEHAQVVDPSDLKLFGKYAVFPSVQPIHAVSDQRWAEQRLGVNRMEGAYAYQSLLEQYGMLAIGTDFPIEPFDPFLNIHAAVERKNAENFPENGFYKHQALSLVSCLKGMTIWPAFASFQEKQLGSLEKGKDATFAVFENPVQNNAQFQPNYAYYTFIKGKLVFSAE